jgi:hypothetical protein
VIRHPTIKAIIDLVQMSIQNVSDGVMIKCKGEVKEVEFEIEVMDVVVKVTTYHNCSIRILPQDVFDDVCHPQRSFLLELLLPWFKLQFNTCTSQSPL